MHVSSPPVPHTWSVYPVEKKLPLHALPIVCGTGYETEASYRWDGLKRGTGEFCVLQYTTGGEGRLVINGANHRIRPGQLMIVPIPGKHVYDLPESSDCWSFFYITATGSEVMRITRAIVAEAGPIHDLDYESQSVRAITAFVDACSHSESRSAYTFSALIYSLFMTLLDEILVIDKTIEPGWMTGVKNVCHSDFRSDITLQHLSDLAGLSKYHFTREFSRYAGTSPLKYLEQLRIQHAIQLLTTHNDPVHAVAKECGYSDTNYFCRAFKKITGLTPGSYRKTSV